MAGGSRSGHLPPRGTSSPLLASRWNALHFGEEALSAAVDGPRRRTGAVQGGGQHSPGDAMIQAVIPPARPGPGRLCRRREQPAVQTELQGTRDGRGH